MFYNICNLNDSIEIFLLYKYSNTVTTINIINFLFIFFKIKILKVKVTLIKDGVGCLIDHTYRKFISGTHTE